jgi:hypothetical protein
MAPDRVEYFDENTLLKRLVFGSSVAKSLRPKETPLLWISFISKESRQLAGLCPPA